MKFQIRIKTGEDSYLSCGTYHSAKHANDVADQFPVRSRPTIHEVETGFEDFVELLMDYHGCDAETAIYEAILEHRLGNSSDAMTAFVEWGLQWDEEAQERLT